MADYYQISILVFSIFIGIILIRDRKNIERSGIMIMRRTEKGKAITDRIVGVSESLWRFMGNLGVGLGVIGMLASVFLIGGPVYRKFFLNEVVLDGPKLVLPSISSSASIGAVSINVPFWFWIIGIAAVVFIHEGMHAVQTRNEKIDIKSSGLLLLAIIPGAFVEPNEEQIKKSKFMQKQRIYAAGSFGNFFLAGVTWLLTALIITPLFFTPAVVWGHLATDDNQTFPAFEANMSGSILAINGVRTQSPEDIGKIMNNTAPGDEVEIETTDGTYDITLAQNPNGGQSGFIGIAFPARSTLFDGTTQVLKDSLRNTTQGNVARFIFELIGWIGILNLGIGVVNLLPLKPLDGGLMFEEFMKKVNPQRGPIVVKAMSMVMLALLVGALSSQFL